MDRCCWLGSPVLECGLRWRLLEAVRDVANCRGSNSGSWPAWRLLAPSASLISMVSSADRALEEQFRIFQAFVSGKDTWPYASMTVPFRWYVRSLWRGNQCRYLELCRCLKCSHYTLSKGIRAFLFLVYLFCLEMSVMSYWQGELTWSVINPQVGRYNCVWR